MQISRATKEELALIITGLRTIAVIEHEPLRKRLLAQMEAELMTRYGATVVEHS